MANNDMRTSGTTSQTVAMPPTDVLKIQILNYRDRVLRAIANHLERNKRTGESETSTHEVSAEVLTFFYFLEGGLSRWLTKDEYKILSEQVHSNKFQSLVLGFRNINMLLDEKRITRVDLEQSYDQTNMELENSIKGLD